MTASERQLIESNVRSLFPGYFAMVMATGIIAIGAAQQDLRWLAQPLYALAAVAYLVLRLTPPEALREHLGIDLDASD